MFSKQQIKRSPVKNTRVQKANQPHKANKSRNVAIPMIINPRYILNRRFQYVHPGIRVGGSWHPVIKYIHPTTPIIRIGGGESCHFNASCPRGFICNNSSIFSAGECVKGCAWNSRCAEGFYCGKGNNCFSIATNEVDQ